ncbi:PIN domain-containing protein [Klenkia sp. LSe6-5]|uniref:Ribonuclease VapC n=1 Tax=Klenkia sesuvii TaxID=3103137 RepID=A0ABU8DXK6_9ACTN
MALSALFDTSVVVAGATLTVPAEFVSGRWAVSSVTLGELEAGVLSAREPTARSRRLAVLLGVAAERGVLSIDRAVASAYGRIRSSTGRGPSNDLWIAATALAHGLVLITADERQARLPLVESRYVG